MMLGRQLGRRFACKSINFIAGFSGLLFVVNASQAVAEDCQPSTAAIDIAIVEAAENAEFGAFRTALKAGGNVNARDAECNTPLIWAARSTHRGIAGELLAVGINFYSTNSQDQTAFDYAKARDAELAGQIDAAIKAYENHVADLVSAGEFERVLLDIDARGLNANQSFGFSDAVRLAAASPYSDDDAILGFIDAMLERGATPNWSWVANDAVDAEHLPVLGRALEHVDPDANLAYAASGQQGPFAAAAIKLMASHPNFGGSLADWLYAATNIRDVEHSLATLKILVKDGQEIGAADSALSQALGNSYGTDLRAPILSFLLSHHISFAPDAPLVIRILDMDSYPDRRPPDLELLELALDRGARADLKVGYDYRPPDVIHALFDGLYDPKNADLRIDVVQLKRVIEKLIRAGAALEPYDYDLPSVAEQVLRATTHGDLKPAVLEALDDLGAKPPPLCDVINRVDVSVLRQLMEFAAFDTDQSDGYECAALIGREQSGTSEDRRAVYRALVEHSVSGRVEALSSELERFDHGGGDRGSVDVLLRPEDRNCDVNEQLANSIAVVLGDPVCP